MIQYDDNDDEIHQHKLHLTTSFPIIFDEIDGKVMSTCEMRWTPSDQQSLTTMGITLPQWRRWNRRWNNYDEDDDDKYEDEEEEHIWNLIFSSDSIVVEVMQRTVEISP